MQHHDIAIIGGGIVGLATAYSLQRRWPDLDVIVLEKETELACHQTGHNSGVIHAGLYYPPGSLKARLCVDGGRRMLEFCDENGIPVVRSGKVVVATSEDQLPALAELEKRGRANGVSITRLDANGVAEHEPHVAGIAGLWVPITSVVDFASVARAYATHAVEGGTEIRTGFEVIAAAPTGQGRRLESPSGTVSARVVVNCGGLHVDRLARLLGHDTNVRIVPFRGEYRTVRPERAHLVRGLIYPVPDPRFPFLGVHFTRDINGRVEVGPNAVLALAREGYRWRDVDAGDLRDLAGFSGLRHLAKAYWRTGIAEMWRSLVKPSFVREAARLVPDLRSSDLSGSRSGVRAQAMLADGTLLQDFAIEETADALHVLNAPSPAATASLEIGDHLATLAAAKVAR